MQLHTDVPTQLSDVAACHQLATPIWISRRIFENSTAITCLSISTGLNKCALPRTRQWQQPWFRYHMESIFESIYSSILLDDKINLILKFFSLRLTLFVSIIIMRYVKINFIILRKGIWPPHLLSASWGQVARATTPNRFCISSRMLLPCTQLATVLRRGFFGLCLF